MAPAASVTNDPPGHWLEIYCVFPSLNPLSFCTHGAGTAPGRLYHQCHSDARRATSAIPRTEPGLLTVHFAVAFGDTVNLSTACFPPLARHTALPTDPTSVPDELVQFSPDEPCSWHIVACQHEFACGTQTYEILPSIVDVNFLTLYCQLEDGN